VERKERGSDYVAMAVEVKDKKKEWIWEEDMAMIQEAHIVSKQGMREYKTRFGPAFTVTHVRPRLVIYTES
jgi:hypothetical protein